MKILLVKPYNLSDHIQPFLGLGYLATGCRDKQHDVIILDCIKENMKIDNLLHKIDGLKPNIVGFQCYTFNLKFVREALEGCKKLNRAMITVIEGPHSSALPRQSF